MGGGCDGFPGLRRRKLGYSTAEQASQTPSCFPHTMYPQRAKTARQKNFARYANYANLPSSLPACRTAFRPLLCVQPMRLDASHQRKPATIYVRAFLQNQKYRPLLQREKSSRGAFIQKSLACGGKYQVVDLGLRRKTPPSTGKLYKNASPLSSRLMFNQQPFFQKTSLRLFLAGIWWLQREACPWSVGPRLSETLPPRSR